jgi:hypothetical protein
MNVVNTPRRSMLVEQQVMSYLHNHHSYSCDFVSHTTACTRPLMSGRTG